MRPVTMSCALRCVQTLRSLPCHNPCLPAISLHRTLRGHSADRAACPQELLLGSSSRVGQKGRLGSPRKVVGLAGGILGLEVFPIPDGGLAVCGPRDIILHSSRRSPGHASRFCASSSHGTEGPALASITSGHASGFALFLPPPGQPSPINHSAGHTWAPRRVPPQVPDPFQGDGAPSPNSVTVHVLPCLPEGPYLPCEPRFSWRASMTSEPA